MEEQIRLDQARRAQQPAPEAGKLPRQPYANRVADFNQRVAAPAAIDYEGLVCDFAAAGVAGLSQHNGLSEDENRRVFVTPHTAEMVFLVLKGLRTLRRTSETFRQ